MRWFRAICLALCVAVFSSAVWAADLRIGVASEVTTLDPHFFHLTSNTEIHKGIYSGLVTQDANMKVVPDLAMSWRTLDDTHWEFKLRPGVTFHDGSPFTADDVVFSFERIPTLLLSPSSFVYAVKPIVQTEVIDPYTLRLHPAGPLPLLPYNLTGVAIVSKKRAEGMTTASFNSLQSA